MFIRKASNGNYYLCRKTPGGDRNWFLIKHSGDRPGGHVRVGNISFPPEMVGERVRLKIELEIMGL